MTDAALHQSQAEVRAPSRASSRIAVLLHDLRGGGAERVSLNLIKGMLQQGREVDLVLVRAEGKFVDQIPKGARVIDLDKSNVFKAVPALVRYLRRERPRALLSSLTHVNLVALVAKALAGVKTRVVVAEHNQISLKAALAKSPRNKLVYRAVPFLYPWADDVVVVSHGVGADLEKFTALGRDRITCIYNPIFDQTLVDAAAMPTDHPWLQPGQPPVLIATGRLHEQKGFDILLKAFEIVRKTTPCRLIVMGEGDERPKLEAMARDLKVSDDVAFPGFVANPYAMMSRARLFVLSSRWEGLPTVLVEALACGLPIVSTDCRSGPDEILEGGRHGTLVRPEDPQALADGIIAALKADKHSGLERARAFDIETSASSYLNVLERS